MNADSNPPRRISRRGMLKGAGTVAAAAATQLPLLRRASASTRSLRVSTFGGYFERMFAAHIYPAYTRATGISVQSVEQPEGAQYLFQLAEANKAGAPPVDIACIEATDVLRGRALRLWRPFNAQRLPNLSQLATRFAQPGPAGWDSVAAMSWYMTFVVNPDELHSLPTSWTELWGNHRNAWGVEPGSVSVIFEITASTFFGGNDVLASKAGIDRVIAKIAQLKPNVKLWWQDEGTMQTALINDEVIGGTYMHDTAMTMIRNGTPVRSIFPKEGAVLSTNFWCQPSASTKVEEAEQYVNFCCTPEAQQLIARFVGSAPVTERSKLNLTDQEFAAVSSTAPPIYAATEAHYHFAAYMEQQFTSMVAS